MKDTILNPIER